MIEIYRAIFVADDGIYTVDVIYHQEEFWIVPEWLDNPSEEWSKPARIIRMGSVPHRKHIGHPRSDFEILFGVPKAVIFGPYPLAEQPQLDHVEAPDIRVVIPMRH